MTPAGVANVHIEAETDLALLTRAALAAGKAALAHFRTDVKVYWKNDGASPVTDADFAANDVLSAILRQARPAYGWLSEENEDDPTRLESERLFVLDPIDGTRAFMDGKDTWVVSAALVRNGRPAAGVLFAPATGEVWQADDTGMVLKDGKPLMAPPEIGDETGDATDDATEPATLTASGPDDMVAMANAALPGRIVRRASVPSLAYRIAMVADGRLDAALIRANAHDWDIAAADLILANVGGRLVGAGGEPPVYNRPVPRHGRMIAANRRVAVPVITALGGRL